MTFFKRGKHSRRCYNNDMFSKTGVLRIVAEDILRFLGEANGKVLSKSVRAGIKARSSLILAAVDSLEKEGSIRQAGGEY